MNESVKVPQLNIGDEFDVTDLVRMRESMLAETSKKYNIRPTLTSFLIKAISLALDDFPILNSRFDVATGDSVRKIKTERERKIESKIYTMAIGRQTEDRVKTER